MTKFDRLEDVTPRWRAYFSENLARAEEAEVLQGVEAILPDRVNVGDPAQVERISEAVRVTRRRRVRESVIPECLAWLRENGFWKDGEARENRALNEIAGALDDGLTPFEPRLPVPVATVRNLSWVIPASVGAAIGSALLGLVFHLLFDSRPIGLFAGGVLGAAGLVAMVGVLASRPDIAAGLETGLKWVGFIAVPLGFWRGLRGQPLGWLRAGGYTLASWLLLGTVRPRVVMPSRAEVLATLGEPIYTLLLHDADLVLAWCWTHPARIETSGPASAMTPVLSSSVCDALGTLRVILADRSSALEDLADAAEATLQRIQEEGYEWRSVKRGTPYDQTMASLFSKFGMIDVGQPVETLKPATVRDGVAVQQGVIRRLRV
ncbi:MAG: hypothetical protein ACLQGP_11025 [Isosphaeraceae bacterium]